ncbi:hypothetical protein BH23CHL7_BH23CHL7_05260 [soil metagenome]
MGVDIVLVLLLTGGFLFGFFRGVGRQAVAIGALLVISSRRPICACRSGSGWPRRRPSLAASTR